MSRTTATSAGMAASLGGAGLRGVALAVGAVLTLGGASSAGAVEILGPANPYPDPLITQHINYSSIPTGTFTNLDPTIPTAARLTASRTGVVTRWRIYTKGLGAGNSVRLRVMTPTGSNNFTVTNSGPAEPLAAEDNSIAREHAFTNQHIPIGAGQHVAFTYSVVNAPFTIALPIGTYPIGFGFAPPPPTADGGSALFTENADRFVAFNAEIEPDVDVDGFGDETQDTSPSACRGLAVTSLGTSGNDVILGTAGNDVVSTGGGDDIVRGLGGDDIICGGDGNDRLKGGAGKDRLYGEAGRDKLQGGGAKDSCFGGADKDAIGCEKAKHK